MYEVHATIGALLITFSAVTSTFFGYKLKTGHKTEQRYSNIVLLSETLAGIVIGVLHVFCYTCSQCEPKNLQDECGKTECHNNSLIMEQITLAVTAVHSFVCLVNSTIFTSKCYECKEVPVRKSETFPNWKGTSGLIAVQWLTPFLTAFCSYYVANAQLQCNATHTTGIGMGTSNGTATGTGLDAFITELLQKPNITNETEHNQEIDNIINKVYSIMGNASVNQVSYIETEYPVYNIIARLSALNNKRRTPKQIGNNNLNNITYKIYTLFLTMFSFLVPILYSNTKRMKMQMLLNMSSSARDIDAGKEMDLNDLQITVTYLGLSLVMAILFWSPSFIEMFTRTYITAHNQSDTMMQTLMSVGSTYILVRNGINFKYFKTLTNKSNTIMPET